VSHEALVVALREMINGSWVLKAIAAAELGLALIVVVGSRLGEPGFIDAADALSRDRLRAVGEPPASRIVAR
jgi:hypothetical protein